jgi:hypothetical protein
MTFLNTRAPAGHKLCIHLRAKEMYYTQVVRPANDDSLLKPGEHDRNHYWCLKTCTPLGPGARPLSMDACGPDRECYVSDRPST